MNTSLFKTKTVAALLTSAALTVGASGAAYANGQAYAHLSFTNISFVNADTLAPLQLGVDISVPDGPFLQTGTNTATRDGNLVGAADSDTVISNGISVDPNQACQGTTCPGQNVFAMQDINTNNFVRSDGNSQGSGFTLADGTLNPFTIELVSEAIQSTNHIDSASGLNQNVAEFSITLAQEAPLALAGSVLLDLYTELQAGTNGSSQATALFEISITDSDDNDIALSFPAGVIDNQVETTQQGEVDQFTLAIPNFSVQTGLLSAGTYNITLDYNTQVQLEIAVPEPAPLGLLGLGLVASVVAGRRRKLRAA